MGFRGKQILVLTAVAAAVALATSLVHALSLARVEVAQTRDSAELLARTLYHQARDLMGRLPAAEVPAALGADPALRSYGEAVVGYSPTVLYLAILDERGVALYHSDPRQHGKPLEHGIALGALSAGTGFEQLRAVLAARHVLVSDLPFSLDGETPFGTVRVAVSSLLLRERFVGQLARSAAIASGIVLVVLLGSFLVANKLFAPIERLRRELARIDTGDAPPLDLRSEGDVNRVAEFFADMSRRLGRDGQSAGGGADATLAELAEGLTEGALILDAEDRVVVANAVAARLVGVAGAENELVARALDPTDDPVARQLVALAATARTSAAIVGPCTVERDVDGGRVGFAVEALGFRSDGGTPWVLLTARDLERASRLGSRLAYSRKLAALGGLASGVAHEVRNPLNGIALRVDLLRRELPDAGRHLDAVEREIRRLDRVLEGFLQLARPDRVQLSPVRIDALLDRVLGKARGRIDAAGVTPEVRVAPDLPAAWGAADLLEQALLNLVLNACDAMAGAGGRLLLAAERAADGRIALRVEDTGGGIPADKLPRIFDLFHTDKPGGSGIGLAVVQRVVELHGGEIDVDSTPGVGTRFTIHLTEAR